MSLQDCSAPHTVRGYGVNIQSFEALAREHISGSRLMVVVRSNLCLKTQVLLSHDTRQFDGGTRAARLRRRFDFDIG